MFLSFLHFFFLLIFIYLAVSTLYLLVFAVAGKVLKTKNFSINPAKKRIAVLIPCYKEDNIILDTALRAVAHNYPADHFKVIVIGDKLQQATIDQLKKIPVTVIEADVNMKSRSLNRALHTLSENDFDIAVVLDADNIMEPGCLEKINDAFNQGYKAIQCHRTAKNKNTPVALLDAISEEININLFRRAPSSLGLSAAPIGSGMAFEFSLLKEIFSLEHILNNPGEDREIDIQLMKRDVKMEFIDDAFVLDEKVASSAVFEKQRIRWLEAQVNHVRRFFEDDLKSAPKNAVYYNKLFQNLLLPRVLSMLLFAFFFVVIVIQWIFKLNLLFPGPLWWFSCMTGYALILFISIPGSYYSTATFKALLHIPVLMFSMVKALLKMKKNRKEFLHTPKTFTSE